MRTVLRLLPFMAAVTLFALGAAQSARADSTCKPAAPAAQSKCQKTSQCCAGLVCQNGRCRSACPIGTACNDGNVCTYGDTCTATGCAGTPIACTSDECSTRACNGTPTCTVTPLTGTPCSDGNACTQNDTCNAGACVSGAPVTCPVPDKCVASEECLAPGTCDPSTGLCSSPSRPDGTACDDGNLCTRNDNCQSGVCTGAPVDCQCHEAGSTCDSTNGLCTNPAKPNYTACDDGSLCTTGDVCYNGGCEGAQQACSSSLPCTLAQCDGETGNCIDTPLTCPSTPSGGCYASGCFAASNACNQLCISPPCGDGSLGCGSVNGCECDADCRDNDPCTTERCDLAVHTCIWNHVNCNDGDACTSDTCDATTGCAHTPITCPAGQECVAGACVSCAAAGTISQNFCSNSSADCNSNVGPSCCSGTAVSVAQPCPLAPGVNFACACN